MHELPLLIFTLCLQGSVGVTVWLALGRQYAVEGRVPARGALPAMAGAFVLACVGLLASALHMGYPPECAKCVTSCRQFVAESRNRLCQPLSGGVGTGGCAAVFPKARLAAAAGAGGSVRAGGCILHGAGLYPCLGGDLAA